MMIPALGQRGLIVGLALVATALAAIMAGNSIGTTSVESTVTRQPLQSRELLFRFEADGSLSVAEKRGRGSQIAVVPEGNQSFIGTTIRLMFRERTRMGRDMDSHFVVTRWTDSRVSLLDPATGQQIELNAFGPTNVEAFARFLPSGKGSK